MEKLSVQAHQALAFARAWYISDNAARRCHVAAKPLNSNGMAARLYSNGLSELVAAGFLRIERVNGEAYLMPTESL